MPIEGSSRASYARIIPLLARKLVFSFKGRATLAPPSPVTLSRLAQVKSWTVIVHSRKKSQLRAVAFRQRLLLQVNSREVLLLGYTYHLLQLCGISFRIILKHIVDDIRFYLIL